MLRFDYLAGAIPFPVDQAARAALGWVPFAQELNRELLTVSGLPDGLYGLSIDGQLVRNFTAAELAAGVDLAAEDTPQMRQAQQLWELFSKELLAPVARLRTLAFVEHFAFPDGQHPLSLAQVEPKIDDWVASAEGKPYQGYLRESGVSYRTDKPLEQSLRDSALQAQPKLAAAAQPVRRRVVVAPASAQ